MNCQPWNQWMWVNDWKEENKEVWIMVNWAASAYPSIDRACRYQETKVEHGVNDAREKIAWVENSCHIASLWATPEATGWLHLHSFSITSRNNKGMNRNIFDHWRLFFRFCPFECIRFLFFPLLNIYWLYWWTVSGVFLHSWFAKTSYVLQRLCNHQSLDWVLYWSLQNNRIVGGSWSNHVGNVQLNAWTCICRR